MNNILKKLKKLEKHRIYIWLFGGHDQSGSCPISIFKFDLISEGNPEDTRVEELLEMGYDLRFGKILKNKYKIIFLL